MAMNPQMSLPRNIVIKKSKDGFGFNIRGQVVEGGQVKSIHGKLYAPLQLVTAVTPGSSAEKAGLCIGDKILQVYVMNILIFERKKNTFFCSLEEMVLMSKVLRTNTLSI